MFWPITSLLLGLCPFVRSNTFSLVWNGPSTRCGQRFNISLPLWQYDIQSNRKQHFYGEKIVLFYENKLGLYPHVDKHGHIKHGGIPQRANLSKHLKIMSKDIRKAIPDVAFNGLAVIDWEAWRPEWKGNWDSRRIYRKLSVQYIKEQRKTQRRRHKRKIRRLARKEFDRSARLFLLATLSIAKQLRPRAKWGFYGYPICDYTAFDGGCSIKTQKLNRNWKWLFDASNALYPSIYLRNSHLAQPQQDRHLYIQAILLEASRAVRKNKHPVYPYTTVAYDLYEKNLHFYSKADLCSSLKQSADLGMNGAVFWFSYQSTSTLHACQQVQNYTFDLLGPYALIVGDQAMRCSQKHCSGQGVCYTAPDKECHTIRPFENYRCNCKHPFKGSECQKNTRLRRNVNPVEPN